MWTYKGGGRERQYQPQCRHPKHSARYVSDAHHERKEPDNGLPDGVAHIGNHSCCQAPAGAQVNLQNIPLLLLRSYEYRLGAGTRPAVVERR